MHLHELLHLIIPNHGKTFKTLLSTYMPKREELHKQITSLSRGREKGNRLNLK